MSARLARSSPNASLRFERTRTIFVGSFPALVLSITACRFEPLPDMRTVVRIGEDIVDCCRVGEVFGEVEEMEFSVPLSIAW